MAVRCESGWVLCRNVAERQCTVCGRFFCASHGDVQAGHCRRCRSAYARRVEATAAAYSEATRQTQAANRNANGLCGWADCHQAPVVICQHCGLLYCAYHTNHYHYRYRYRSRRGVEWHRAEIILCDACKSSLPDYKREKTWLEV